MYTLHTAAAAAGTTAGTVVSRSHRPAAPAAQEERGGGLSRSGGGMSRSGGGATSQPSMSVRALRYQTEEEEPEEKEEDKETPWLSAPLPPSVTIPPPDVSSSASGISDESLPEENVWKRQSPYRWRDLCHPLYIPFLSPPRPPPRCVTLSMRRSRRE